MIEVIIFLITLLCCVVYRLRYAEAVPVLNSLDCSDIKEEYDYIVIGAGPGGVSAACELLKADNDATVLLLEAGSGFVPKGLLHKLVHFFSTSKLLAYSNQGTAIPPGAVPGPGIFERNSTNVEPFVLRRPLRQRVEIEVNKEEDISSEASENKAKKYKEQEGYVMFPPFSKGVGLGGTSLISWGLMFSSVFPPEQRVSSTITSSIESEKIMHFSPLSKAFSETLKRSLKQEKFEGFECPSSLLLNQDGRRKSVVFSLLLQLSASQLSRLTFVQNSRVVDLVAVKENGSAVVRAVAVQSITNAAEVHRVQVRKGVVLCAGSIHTPRMLARLKKSVQPNWEAPQLLYSRDAIALPLIFKSYRGLSFDGVNTHTLQNFIAWFTLGKGPLLHPMTDCYGYFPIEGPKNLRTRVAMIVLPFGGRDAKQFYRMGWDRSLSSFLEAFTVLLVVENLDFLKFSFDVEPSPESQTWRKHRGVSPLSCDESVDTFTADQKNTLLHVLRAAVRKTRKILKEPPITHLSTGGEAIDFTLLSEDPVRALKLARLVHTPLKKYTRKMKEEVVEYSEWAVELSKKDKYLDAYICNHSYWLGASWGASEPFLEGTTSAKVAGFQNLTVGDVSGVREDMCKIANMSAFAASSVNSAIDAGSLAAKELSSL